MTVCPSIVVLIACYNTVIVAETIPLSLCPLLLSSQPRAAIENAKMMIDGDAEAKKLRTMVRPMLSHDAEARGLDYRIAGISTVFGTEKRGHAHI